MSGPVQIKYSYVDVPTLQAFSDSNAFIRGLIGPIGAGKSSACVVEMVRRGMAQEPGPDGIRRSRWGVVRQTFPELRDTTIRTVFEWLPPQYFGRYLESKHSYTIKAFENTEIEILFMALERPDDVKKLLSLELTGAWVNEAREVPWAVIETLQGRLGRYPSARQGGATWSGLWLDTNAPDADSAWHSFFEGKKWLADFKRLQHEGLLPAGMNPDDYVALFKQPSGLSPQAENLKNLPGGRLYYSRVMAGKSAEWIKIYVHGEYGFLVDGMPIFPEYSDRIHCQEVDPMPGVPVIRSYDWGLCYSDDTEVLTNNGWKLFKDVDENVDLAASRDPATGRMEFAPIGFKVAQPYKGDMLEWASTELNMLVTPDHRIPYSCREGAKDVRWASAQWLADNMGGHHYVDLVSHWEPPKQPSAVWGMDPRDFAAFMGLFLSDGHAAADGRIAVYQLKEKTRAEMQGILDRTGLRWKWFEYEKYGKTACAGWRTHHREFCAWLASYGLQKVRHVPNEVKSLGRECLLAFIEAYTLGDGNIRTRPNGSVEHRLFTSSYRMAQDFQEIAQKVGWNSSVNWRKPQTSVITEGNRQRAIVNEGGWDVGFKKSAVRAELLKRNFSRVPYDGMVYCLNVPWHTLYVRRNGKPHWNGNTPACAFSQLLPDGRWLTFDEMVSTNMSADEFGDDVVEHCSRAFKGDVQFEDWGDPAGEQRAQTDKRTCFEIMETKGIYVRGSIQNPQLRHEAVRKPLRTLVNGEPQFILHPRCKQLRKGLMGGYHRRRLRTSGPERYSDQAEKNSFSHICEALEYGMVQYFGADLTRIAGEYDDWPEPHELGPSGRSDYTGY